MADATREYTLRLVLTPTGQREAEAIAARLRALGIGDIAVTSRAINLKCSADQLAAQFGIRQAGSGLPDPPGPDALRRLGLDEYVKYAYFPTKPEFFGR